MTAGRRPLTAMKVKVYMNYVNDFVDWLKTVDGVPADPVCRKRLAATLVQHSVLYWKHLDSIDPESPASAASDTGRAAPPRDSPGHTVRAE